MVVLQVFKPEINDVALVNEEVLDSEVVEDNIINLVMKRDGNMELSIRLIFHPN